MLPDAGHGAQSQHGELFLANAVIAAFLRFGQLHVLAQQIKQRGARVECQVVSLAVDGQCHRTGGLRRI